MHKKQRSYFYFLLPLLCLVLLGISSRSALAYTLQTTDTPLPPSSTPTYEPLFKTPTALPTLVSGCPSGTPIGWGTVTPGALWSAQCGPCVLTLTPQMTGTAYPLPSAFVGLTQTAIALTGTATPTRTATATATPVTTCAIGNGQVVSWNPAAYQGTGAGPGSSTGSIDVTIPYNLGRATLTEHISFSVGGYPRDFLNGLSVSIHSTSGNVTYFYDWQYTRISGCDYSDQGTTWSGSGSTVCGTGYCGLNFRCHGTWNTTNEAYVTVHISSSPGCLMGTATPPATATPIAPYCGTVNGATQVDISDLPNVRIGPSTCAAMGPYSIGLSSLNWLPGLSGITDVSLPKVEICFREIYFGAVKVFGISFDLDILSAVITGVLALRWLFRS